MWVGFFITTALFPLFLFCVTRTNFAVPMLDEYKLTPLVLYVVISNNSGRFLYVFASPPSAPRRRRGHMNLETQAGRRPVNVRKLHVRIVSTFSMRNRSQCTSVGYSGVSWTYPFSHGNANLCFTRFLATVPRYWWNFMSLVSSTATPSATDPVIYNVSAAVLSCFSSVDCSLLRFESRCTRRNSVRAAMTTYSDIAPVSNKCRGVDINNNPVSWLCPYLHAPLSLDATAIFDTE